MTHTLPVGIHDLSFATTHYALDHAVLAERLGVDRDKFYLGIGQEKMSVAAADEDIVTIAAAAAAPILERHGTDNIRTVLLATETGVDQSKAAALYLHSLIGLPNAARVVELKQACYGGTAGLQFAAGLIARDPAQRVLVIAADIAKYDLDSPGEPTQGAAAVAMLVTANPAILQLDPQSGLYSADIMDFWRPNYRSAAIVDGKTSVNAYQKAAQEAWTDYRRQGGRDLGEFAAFCYHQPFTKMAYKAHRHLLESQGHTADAAAIEAAIGDTTRYNRTVGNSYTASLYLGLAALLDHAGDLTDRALAMISYGSGSVAEFFSGTVQPGYREHLRTAANRAAIDSRELIGYEHYRQLHEAGSPSDGAYHAMAEETRRPYRLAAVSGHKRIYEAR
ncbi:hydroxymethylglutaryl-CoA synthase [Nocardia asteroides]|uniref:3-hydroxy-3-methylglutaryl-CoA synthase n=1 Tax=Nocardia asteroides NBRC 15531 TaxID=1110697 RepID=U5EKR4_NOCAS|nr:hydroxymethylglutaryl-CoA synthase [Nocardia asteroides]TLF67530.1 hydroxymethylglutaryl-CoA synthase [Nocardia asteroides NBRC 15531]UGT50971.1 hydroxymethylglutaryl-CoA synthase [Nocardia asteroides]SFN43226.1 hydroxymethylglutaryl-CoA synthase [Nocardia asteroides]VEG36169.1 Polyketide biosynthesis 3-hydroxy-3 -methylglutaryl-ACP synthase pksG [Nocardia asteroides]GAD85669.1 3-hydroxy-3-methylglutaryl-CoA synthase [Nocardia asteroides NBRC 15531]